MANLPLSPVMAFISTTETVVGVQIQQIYTRYIEPGQEVEVTFKFFPGQVFAGKVVSVLAATSTGQGLDLRNGRSTHAGHGGTLRGAGQTGRRQARGQPPGRHRRRCGDLHPAYQAGARYPQGYPAAECDFELRQPILSASREP